MPATIELFDDELRELRVLLERELTSGRIELHRTDAFAYKQYVRERLDRIESLLRKVESVSAEPVSGAGAAVAGE